MEKKPKNIILCEPTVKYEIVAEKTNIQKLTITQPSDAYDYAKRLYASDILIYESFYVLFLNRSNDIIGYYKVSQGGTTATTVDKRLICKAAIDILAQGAIIVHNHPSGNLKPSESDNLIVNDLKKGLALFDIMLMDSLILSDKGYFSYADDGRI